MKQLDYQPSCRRRLPHIQPPGATIFITTRLHNSLPQVDIEQLIAEAKSHENQLNQIPDPWQRQEQQDINQRRLFGKWDQALDTAKDGPFWLQDKRVAQVVMARLHEENGRLYDLDAFCIMSNHTHVVCTPLAKPDKTYHSLATIMKTIKGSTARQANEILGRSGSFWQRENYDHVVRDEAEKQRIIRYVLMNPVKAGLVQSWDDWPYSYTKGSLENNFGVSKT
jgi:REP element-mobilizing transposase RayT